MHRTEVLQRIRNTGLIPVVRAESAAMAMRAAEAIKLAGVDILEVTMTVPGAIDVISKLVATFENEMVIGAGAVKVFPAGAVGGARYLKALKAPLPQIELVPTGGVSLKTAGDFVKAGALALGVGADLVDTKALRENRDEVITERARQFLEIVREARAA